MAVSALLLESCRGVKPSGCRFALPLPGAFAAGLEALAARAPVPAFFASLDRPPRHHERLRLSLCACANGCARPQVADLGLLAAREIAVRTDRCTGCGACVAACPDGAFALREGVAALDAACCLGCGRCLAVCPAEALTAGPVAFRVTLGGRLGRRPRLGLELPVRFSPQATLAMVERCLRAHAALSRPGGRLADILFPDGQPGLPAWVWA